MYNQITRGQRYEISALIKAGHRSKEIYTQLGINRSTYYAEIRRNRNEATGRYSASYAEMCVEVRKERYKRPRKMTPRMVRFIDGHLRQDWSPEQIEGYCRREGLPVVSAKWIYHHIARDRDSGGDLWEHCRHRLKHRRRPVGQKGGPIAGRVSIDRRPPEADGSRYGDWEMDLIVGRGGHGAMLTLVERKTDYSMICRLPEGKNAQAVARAAWRLLMPYRHSVLTITTDNGSEFSAHKWLAGKLGTTVYFAHPYSSWEKGNIENTNGLYRQYIPKNADFSQFSDKQLTEIQNIINKRPRKKLGFSSPVKEFFRHLH